MTVRVELNRAASAVVSPDGRAVLTMDSYGDSGMGWSVDVVDGECVVLDHVVEPGTSFGGRGTESFTVQVTGPSCELKARLIAPWRTRPAGESTINLRVARSE